MTGDRERKIKNRKRIGGIKIKYQIPKNKMVIYIKVIKFKDKKQPMQKVLTRPSRRNHLRAETQFNLTSDKSQ